MEPWTYLGLWNELGTAIAGNYLCIKIKGLVLRIDELGYLHSPVYQSFSNRLSFFCCRNTSDSRRWHKTEQHILAHLKSFHYAYLKEDTFPRRNPQIMKKKW